MCGIAGGFRYAVTAAARPLDDEVRRACERMARRGPDGSGLWRSPDGRVVLGHRRLSIIDLSERGAQPMRSADASRVITFNGEIYNYRALRAGLEREGRPLISTSDTEVVLALYEQRSDRVVDDLRGMFAFAIWDAQRGALLLARDPYGIKPLYYADDGSVFRFASQVKALLAGGGVASALDPAGIAGFCLLGSVPEPFTIRRAIRALPAGSFIWVDERGASQPRSYFELARVLGDAARHAGAAASETRAERVRTALVDSVRHHLVADVPVGLFLSAGIDSGALAGLMRELSSSPIQSVTIAFDELAQSEQDESPLARQVAAHYGLAHARRLVTRDEFEADLPAILDAMDQPSIDGVNTWFASKAARELGLKVAVSGLGGDELWGGYPSFKDIPAWVRLCRTAARVPGLGVTVRRALAPLLARSALSPKLAGLLELGGSYPGAYLLRRGLFMPWELPSLFDPELVREGLLRLQIVEHIAQRMQPDPGTSFGRVAALEAALYMRNQLLRDTDWASMAHSLEVRTPLVDSTLLAAVAPLVLDSPGSAAKQLLAGSARPALPSAIAGRKKTGFGTPVSTWLVQSRQLDAWRALPALAREGCHWSRRFAYVVLQRFLRDEAPREHADMSALRL
jgi:asparagine synthase (glutamine-hydrolysing)